MGKCAGENVKSTEIYNLSDGDSHCENKILLSPYIYILAKYVDKHRNILEFLSVNKELFLWMNFGSLFVLLMYIFHFYIDYLVDVWSLDSWCT